VDTLDVTLDEQVVLGSFTYADLTLTRDGSVVTLDDTVTAAYVSGKAYRIAGLAGFTDAEGAYQLTVSAAGLMDRAGNAGVGQASRTWTLSQSLPTGIRGTSYEDMDGDGVRDAGELPIAGRTVFLDANSNGGLDQDEISVLTAADGAYVFDNLGAGTYRVAQVLPAGWTLIAPTAGAYEVVLAEGQTATGRDFANFRTGEIRGVKFHDLDADGSREAGEPVLAGWTIFLDVDRDGVLDAGEASVVTGEDGAFAFTGIGPSLVQVGEVAQEGWARITPETPYRVRSGFTATADMGNVHLGSLSGIKYEDLDGDGVRDAGEPGLVGWTIFLDRNADGALDQDEVSTQTDADGRYTFTGLLPGLYTLAEVQRAGWTQTSPLGTVTNGLAGFNTSASGVSMESLGCG